MDQGKISLATCGIRHGPRQLEYGRPAPRVLDRLHDYSERVPMGERAPTPVLRYRVPVARQGNDRGAIHAFPRSTLAANKEVTIMTGETSVNSRRVAEQLVSAFNAGDLSRVDDLVATDVVYHLPPGGESLRGIEAFRQFLADSRQGFASAG
jgi:hypothetical protein